MLEVARLQPGYRCLDIAAGTGDLTFGAGERVGPGGYVLATDLSDKMVQIIREGGADRKLPNVEARAMDGENLPLPDNDFDTVFCRFALHLMPSPPRALAEWHRVLKPAGRAVIGVWSTADTNPWASIPVTAIRRQARVPLRRVPGQSDLFSLGGGVLEAGLREAGFDPVEVHRIATPLRMPSAHVFGQMARDFFNGVNVMMARLPPEKRALAWDEVDQAMRAFEGPSGFEVPGESLIGVGVKAA
jgi:SAM-dependent methyltransferase